jgi:hypothetical protein
MRYKKEEWISFVKKVRGPNSFDATDIKFLLIKNYEHSGHSKWKIEKLIVP